MSTTEEPMIRPCKGDCGRMTRPRDTPARGVKDVVAGTIARVDGSYCSACYKRLSPAATAAREREAARAKREKDERLAAAFKARDDLAAARQARLSRASQRQMGAAVLARTQRRVSA